MAKTRNYSDDFRQEAVSLLLSSGRPLKVAAQELGVTANTLRSWRDKALGSGHAGKTDARRLPGEVAAGVPAADVAAQIRRLQRGSGVSAPTTRDLKKSHEHTLRGPAERYAMIDQLREDFEVAELCHALSVTIPLKFTGRIALRQSAARRVRQ